MRVYIWSRSTAPGAEADRGNLNGASPPIVIELTAWLRVFMIVAGAFVAVPLAGLIGFRHGFAEVVGVPDLQRELGSSLSDGVRLLLAAPQRIFDAGLGDTATLLIALLLVIAGAGALALVVFGSQLPSASSQDSEPSAAVAAASALGLIACIVVSLLQIGWVASRSGELLDDLMPWTGEPFNAWLAAVRVTAGVDFIALGAAVLWLLVAARLRSMLWLRALTLVIAAGAVAALFAAASITNSIAAQIDQTRSLFLNSDGSRNTEPDLILGHTRTHLVVVSDAGDLRLISPDVTITVIGRTSIAEFIGASDEP